MPITIQGGAVRINTDYEEDAYEYRYGDREGEHVVYFHSSFTPRIGDIIQDDGSLIRPIPPPINQDKSRWIKKDYDTWGRQDIIE